MRVAVYLTLLLTVVAGMPAMAGNLYGVCAACHGANGEGSEDLNAPRIAGMPAWYVQRQINNFKAGVRGADSKDVYGTQMRPMAMTLGDDKSVAAVAQQIEAFEAPAAATTVEGDIEKGKAAYATCAACHGADGRGNEALNAPPLVGQHDWYIVRQLQAFKSGLRGTHEKDVYGQQMRPMAMILADDAAIEAVTAYIMTLDD
ncbi:MAG: c-type cytochrome [Gammaproteobacteria bacterium]|nr:c-type cytochrome [Gammaproteobacteria bacterium]